MTDRYGHDMAPADMVERIGRDDPLLLECGCHDGRDTVKFLAAFPKCHLVCFEPDPRPIDRHQPPGFLDRIGDDPRVTLVRAAVADRDGMATMYRSSGMPPGENPETTDYDHSGGILLPTGHLDYSPWVTFPKSHRLNVPTWALDTWLDAHWPKGREIDFIWVDVQGAHGKLIAGARETLKRTRWFYTEYAPKGELYEGEPTREEIEAMLPDFRIVAIYTDNLLFERKDI